MSNHIVRVDSPTVVLGHLLDMIYKCERYAERGALNREDLLEHCGQMLNEGLRLQVSLMAEHQERQQAVLENQLLESIEAQLKEQVRNKNGGAE